MDIGDLPRPSPPEPKAQDLNSQPARTCYEAFLAINGQLATTLRDQPDVTQQAISQLKSEIGNLASEKQVAARDHFRSIAYNLAQEIDARETLTVLLKLIPTIPQEGERTRVQAATAALLTSLASDSPYWQDWKTLRDQVINAASADSREPYRNSSLAQFTTDDFQNDSIRGSIGGLENQFDPWKEFVFLATQESQTLDPHETELKAKLEAQAARRKGFTI